MKQRKLRGRPRSHGWHCGVIRIGGKRSPIEWIPIRAVARRLRANWSIEPMLDLTGSTEQQLTDLVVKPPERKQTLGPNTVILRPKNTE